MDLLFADRIEVCVTHPRTGRTVISTFLYRLLFPVGELGRSSPTDATHAGATLKDIPYRYPDGRLPVGSEAGEPEKRAGKPERFTCAEDGHDGRPDSTQSPASVANRNIRKPKSMRNPEMAIPAFALEYPAEGGLLSMQAIPTLVEYLAAGGTRLLPVRVTERVTGRSRWFEVETFHGNAAGWHLHKSFAKKDHALEEAKAMGW